VSKIRHTAAHTSTATERTIQATTDSPTGPFANIFFIGVTLDERDEHMALTDLKELSSAR